MDQRPIGIFDSGVGGLTVALDELRAAYPVPVVDVIEPTARAAVRLTRNRSVGVIGTAGTIGSGRYLEAIEATRENVAVTANACAEFVEFVERGETTGKTILDLAAGYLAPLVEAEVDTLILGCTHYPLLTGVLSYILGPDVFLLSSGDPEQFRRVGSRFLGPEVGTVERRSATADPGTADPGTDDPGAARTVGAGTS